MAPRRLARTTLAATAVLALGACDPEPAETEVAPPTEQVAMEQLASAADEVCTGTRAELQPLRGELFGDEDLTGSEELPAAERMEPADAQQSFQRAGALLRTELRQLRELEVSQAAQADVEAWLEQVESAAAAYEEAAESPEAAEQLLGGEDPLRSAEETADELGLGYCGTERLPVDETGDPRAVPTPGEDADAPAVDQTPEEEAADL